MTDAVRSAGARERDTVLMALEMLQSLAMPRSLTAIVMFLYVCENEGLIVSELADIAGVTVPIAARFAKMLAGEFSGCAVRPEARLLELRVGGDKRLRYVHLTEHGRRVRDQLDRLIHKAVAIGGGARA